MVLVGCIHLHGHKCICHTNPLKSSNTFQLVGMLKLHLCAACPMRDCKANDYYKPIAVLSIIACLDTNTADCVLIIPNKGYKVLQIAGTEAHSRHTSRQHSVLTPRRPLWVIQVTIDPRLGLLGRNLG